MTDFCYIANALFIVFLNVYPKSEELFITSFLFAHGSLMVAVGAFRNQMVFHSIDNMSSLALHMYPCILMYNIHWNTMEYEKDLPESERRFLSYDKNKAFNVWNFIVIPIFMYVCWMILYFTINFVISAKKIKDKNYETMYNYYERKPWAKKLFDRKGCIRGPLLFLSFHFFFFCLCHIYAIMCFMNIYICTISLCFWLTWSIWNSSCFYMDYFSKKYEASLTRLDQVQ